MKASGTGNFGGSIRRQRLLGLRATRTGTGSNGSAFRWRLVLEAIPPAMLFLVGCSQPRHLELSPPVGYRAIAESEYPRSWQRVADLIPTPDRAVGDFDGDSIVDEARLWVREGGDGWVLMAYLSSMPFEPVRVFESPSRLSNRPIRTIPPGEHRTDQYYGLGPGPPDTTAIVHFDHDAINLGRVESEGTTYIWNQETRSFDPVAMY